MLSQNLPYPRHGASRLIPRDYGAEAAAYNYRSPRNERMTNRDPVELAAKQAVRDRVLRAIALNRHPGLHFAGHFLGIAWKEVSNPNVAQTR